MQALEASAYTSIRGMGLNRMWRHDDAHYQAYLKEWTAMANAQLALK